MTRCDVLLPPCSSFLPISYLSIACPSPASRFQPVASTERFRPRSWWRRSARCSTRSSRSSGR